ncbi:hypothetical protein CGGC5_v017222 [Colletotrichum fructicola Nara gc5]|uniref:Uncharacterized protein n=1 Tax=Colletotrichum fructicola (strain Nara gc5) TaxID=1213859 RepID=A0A7J6IEZ6_COLFN|nr:hypothetical protein CGGC5_v017222 [Colletotrichum fructicola Nara gc5]
MKKLSAKESTSVFGRPSEYGGQRRTQGEGGRLDLHCDPPSEASSPHPAIASRRDNQPLIHARLFPKLTVLQFRPAARKLSACDREELRTGTGTDGVRNDTTGTDIRLYVLAQTDTVVRQKKLPKEHVANKH